MAEESVPREVEVILVEDSDSGDLAEVYSVPRVVPFAARLGLKASLSVDILLGDNLVHTDGRAGLLAELARRRALMLILSPPCTMYSCLNRSLNFGKMHPEIKAARLREADAMVDFAMFLAKQQVQSGRYFVFEHPLSATSWSLPSVKAVAELEGVRRASFDQCAFGLKSPRGQPMKKPTALLTNSAFVYSAFNGKSCRCDQPHLHIIGSEDYVRLAGFAAHYPPALCQALAEAAQRHRECRAAPG